MPNFNTPKLFLLLIVVLGHLAFGVGPATAQGSPPDRRFGAVEAFRDPVAAAEAGVGWDRILFYWSELQPNGPDDWNGYHVPDDWLRLAAEADREVVGLLKHTPAWATDDQPLCGVPRGLDLPVDDPGNLWAAFVRRVASIYAGRVDRWIIWNEPDIPVGTFGCEWCGTMEDYYRLLKVAYLAAHQVNPDAKIHLAGATTWHDPDYLRDFLSIATQDPEGAEHGYFFDAISLHIYFRTETVPQIIGAARASLSAYGIQKPIWVNETNAPSNSDPPYWELPDANFNISLEEQGSFLLQAFALSLSAGAERVAVYKWMDNEPQPGVEPFGLIRTDYSRRPAYEAYRLITSHYAGAFSARKDRQPLYTVVTLDRGQLTTRVLWARTESDVTLSLPALASQARLIDQTGAEQVLAPADGQYTLTLPGARCADRRGCIIGGPTYLLVEESSGPPPATSTPAASSPTATSPPGTPTPITTATPTLPSTSTLTPTLTSPSSPTAFPTATPSPTPSPTATPTATPSPTSSPTATSTSTPTSTPTPTFTATPTPTATPLPSPTPSPTPTPTPPALNLLTLGSPMGLVLAALAAVIVSAVLVGVRIRRGRR